MDNEPVIECRDLVCGYGSTVVLEDINMTVARGEIRALLGGSGSGKSTLMRTIIGLQRPLSGTCTLFGEDLSRLPEMARNDLLRRTGMLFQYGALFGSMTNLDNVALPLRQHTKLSEAVIEEIVYQRLALVGLQGLERRLPSSVSGGQRKRVALARATILDPEIVFCDEPSAGLDPVVASSLDQTLRHFQSSFRMTMVVVTHELESVKVLADRITMLYGGHIIASGTFDEMMASTHERVHRFFHRMPEEVDGNKQSVYDQFFGDHVSEKRGR